MTAVAGRDLAGSTGRRIVRGRVVDATSGGPIQNAQVFVEDLRVGSLTGPDGSFRLSWNESREDPADRDLTLTVQLIGYGEERRELTPREGTVVLEDVRLSQVAVELAEIVVTGATPDADREPEAEVDTTRCGGP